MADPKNKYADLPGIAPPDEKDVYETDDLPEADQDDYMDEPESEFIERPHINPKVAHDKFKWKGLIPSKDTDFSDAAKRRRNIGYAAINGDWEIAAVGEEETLQQRRHRLEAEFRLLIEDLNKLKDAEKSSEEDAKLAKTLVPELESSYRHLAELQVPDVTADLTANPGQHIQNIQKLLKELSENKSTKGSGKTVQIGAPAGTSPDKLSRIADLEMRLKQLEDVLGTTPDNLNRLQLSEVKSLSGGVTELSARINLLDLKSIDSVDQKLGSVLIKMNSIVEKRGGPEKVEEDAKLNEIYDSYKKVEALSQSLIPIADRLSALSSLHQEAGEFKKTLALLKADMASMTTKIAADEAAVESVRVAMKEVLETTTASIATFNERLKALKK